MTKITRSGAKSPNFTDSGCTQCHRFRRVFAADSREYALWIDGAIAAWGRSTQAVAATEPNNHYVGIGDGSGGVDGQVELRFARAGILKR